MIVVGIETSTPQTSVAIGTENEILARASVAGAARQESVTPLLQQLLRGSDLTLVAGGRDRGGRSGPGCSRGCGSGVETAKTLAQVAGVPIVGLTSLDALAYAVRYSSRRIAAVIDARRGEVFSAIYRAVPGGVVREREYEVHAPDRLAAELQALPGEVLAVGNGAMLYRHVLEEIRNPDRVRVVDRRAPRRCRVGRARRASVPARGARSLVRRRPPVPEEVRC